MRKQKLLTLIAVMMAFIFAAGSAFSAELTLDQTVEVMHQDTGQNFDVSVYPGAASYSGQDGAGNPVTGDFGDRVVLDYRFFTTENDAMISYADGGAGFINPVTSPPGENVNAQESWADVWMTTDPAGFTSTPDRTDQTIARAQNFTGTIDISELKYGSIYFIYGSYAGWNTIDITMSGPGLEDIAISNTEDPSTMSNIAWISKVDFVADGYDTITYTYTNVDVDASRARFMGVVLDAITIYETEVIYPQNGEVVPPGDVTLEWINMDPNTADQIYVDVWFGTDPNKVDGDYTKIVDGQSVSTKTVLDLAPGVYYWQVDSYIHGDPAVVDYSTGDPCMLEGSVYMFTNDGPIASVNVGPDMVTWDGQPVGLVADVTDDGGSPLTYSWTTSTLPSGVSAVFNPSANDETTAVTFTMEPYTTASVLNASFESQQVADGTSTDDGNVDDWNVVGFGGLMNPDTATYSLVPDGENAVWVNNGAYASQVISETIQENATYTLNVDVGFNEEYGQNATYLVQLLAGDGPDAAVVAEDDDSIAITPGTFETSTITYTNDPVADANKIGLPLQIKLACTSTEDSSSDAQFDNVVLTTDTPYPAPETASVDVSLTVQDAINPAVSDTMTIDIYGDACEAARIGLDLDLPTDFDKDCQVNPVDLATMAANWLNDEKNLDQAVSDPGNNWPGNIFSVNFYAYNGLSADEHENVTLEPEQSAGYGEWLISGWENILIPWKPSSPQDPVTITSSEGSAATLTFMETRNGGGGMTNTGIRTVAEGDGNGDLFDTTALGTLEDPANPADITHIEVSDIPFTGYDVILYLNMHQWAVGDQTGIIELNGQQTAFATDHFDGTFTEIVNDGDTGNYIVFEDVTGSLTAKVWGNGGNHLGLSGFQIRESDPNAPDVSADSMITWLGEPATLDATVDGTNSLWDMTDVVYNWTADATGLDVAIDDPTIEDPTVTIDRTVSYVWDIPLENPSFENGTTGWTLTGTGESITYGGGKYDGVKPDGDYVLYISQDNYAYQVLNETVYEGATYTLTVDAGFDTFWGESTIYRVQLVAGEGEDAVVLAEDSAFIDDPNSYYPVTVTYTNDPSTDADKVGQPLQIRLGCDAGSNINAFYDNVQLTTDAPTKPLAPVKMTLTLTEQATGNTVATSAYVDVYENPCDAAVASDPAMEYVLGDLSQDCFVTMDDLAIFGEDWLKDISLTEPESKPTQ